VLTVGEEKYRKAFGEALEAQLSKRNVRPSHLASSTGYTRGYISNLMNGRKNASPEWCDRIANELGLSDTERMELHQAAAESLGYRIRLKKDEKE
jgi:plasmid maintenance system antidote protein VapI